MNSVQQSINGDSVVNKLYCGASSSSRNMLFHHYSTRKTPCEPTLVTSLEVSTTNQRCNNYIVGMLLFFKSVGYCTLTHNLYICTNTAMHPCTPIPGFSAPNSPSSPFPLLWHLHSLPTPQTLAHWRENMTTSCHYDPACLMFLIHPFRMRPISLHFLCSHCFNLCSGLLLQLLSMTSFTVVALQGLWSQFPSLG